MFRSVLAPLLTATALALATGVATSQAGTAGTGAAGISDFCDTPGESLATAEEIAVVAD